MFSGGFEVDFGSWKLDFAEAKCQQHFSVTGNLTELKKALQLNKLPWDATADGLF